MDGQPMTIFGDGKQTRAFSYIDDVAPFIAASAENPAAYNEVINIGADSAYSVNELASVVAQAFDIKPVIEHLPARNEVVHAYSDHSKARRLFGLGNPIALEEGIRRMAEWARRVGSRKSQFFESIEVSRNLPLSWRREVVCA